MYAYAQNTMVVHTKNGTTKFQIEELDSITFVTDTLIEQTPQGTISEESIYNDENSIKSVIYSCYSSLSQYVSLQWQVEGTYCIPLLCEDGQVYPLFASDRIIYDLWKTGYQTINRTNTAIRFLKSMEGDFAEEALAHALVIRSFVYYNMSMLWGTIPYVDENIDVDNFESQIQVLSQPEIIQKLLADDMLSLYSRIQNESAFIDGEHRIFEHGSLKVLLAEMQLICKNKTEAVSLLSGESQIFNTDYTDASSYRYYVNVYTYYYIDHLMLEARGHADWPIIKSDYYWGAWAAYKRTGMAEEKIQKLHPELKHRLLLPIPKNELMLSPNLKQNEGYDY